jgi:hypothetical protein
MRVIVAMIIVLMMGMAGMGMGVIVMGVRGRAMIMGAASGVSAALRIERRFYGDDVAAQAARHILDDGVAADAQAAPRQLRRQVAVAEMPRDAKKRLGINAAYFSERLGRGDDLDEALVVENEGVAAPQQHSLLKIEKKRQAAHALHRHPAAMAIVIVEHNGVGGRPRPGANGANGSSHDHCRGSKGGAAGIARRFYRFCDRGGRSSHQPPIARAPNASRTASYPTRVVSGFAGLLSILLTR